MPHLSVNNDDVVECESMGDHPIDMEDHPMDIEDPKYFEESC